MKTTTTKKATNRAYELMVIADQPKLGLLNEVLQEYVVSNKKLESAQVVRDRMVVKFADTCREKCGWADLTGIKAKGENRAEYMDMIAKAYLPASKYAAWFKTGGKGSRGTAGVLANNIVKNRANGLIEAVEKFWARDAADKTPNAKGEPKGASRNKALAVFIAEQVDAILKRIGDDARKENPTGTNHAELKKVFDVTKKTIAPMLHDPKH